MGAGWVIASSRSGFDRNDRSDAGKSTPMSAPALAMPANSWYTLDMTLSYPARPWAITFAALEACASL